MPPLPCAYADRLVRMSPELLAELRRNGSAGHADEFADAVGVVEGWVFWGRKGDAGDEGDPDLYDDDFVDVRWLPEWLRYSYRPEGLLYWSMRRKEWLAWEEVAPQE